MCVPMQGVHVRADARRVRVCGCEACMHACMRMPMRGVHAHADARYEACELAPGHGEFPHVRRLEPQLATLLRLAVLGTLEGELVKWRRRNSVRPG